MHKTRENIFHTKNVPIRYIMSHSSKYIINKEYEHIVDRIHSSRRSHLKLTWLRELDTFQCSDILQKVGSPDLRATGVENVQVADTNSFWFGGHMKEKHY